MDQASAGCGMRIDDFTRDHIAETFLHCKTDPAELVRLLVFVRPSAALG
jgi:hypothetical protein